LNGSAGSVRLNENDAVRAPFQFLMLLETLFVFLELCAGDEVY
jgi:hypothetical protein